MELGNKLHLPKGDGISSALILDLEPIYYAESRLHDIKTVTPMTAPELMGTFNEAANTVATYRAKLQYEMLVAKQNFDRRKAIVVLDEMPELLKQLAERGMKSNEDVREAIITKDAECFKFRDRFEYLQATDTLLESKIKTFVRAYNAAKNVAESRSYMAAAPRLSYGTEEFVEHE